MNLAYAEVPGFYAEVERSFDPELADRPVIVGGDPRKKGLVQSATPDAVAQGVSVGMTVLDALELCPHGRALRTNMKRYREAGSRLRSSLRRVLDRLEPSGLDAAYLDAADREEPPTRLGQRLQEAVRRDLAVPLSVGFAPVKFLARLAARDAGDAGIRAIARDDVADFLHPLPVSRLPGVGPKTEQRLNALGASTVADLLTLGRERLESELGNHGLTILSYAMGQDENRLRVARHPQSVSQESTFETAQLDRLALDERLQSLAQHLEGALRRDGLAARRVALKLRYEDQEVTTRTRTLGPAVAVAADLYAVACELLDRTAAGARPVRLVGLTLSGLRRTQRDDRQLELFDEPQKP